MSTPLRRTQSRHRELFASEIDLIIVDETHFGARAEEYGRVLRDAGQPVDDAKALARGKDDQIDTAEAQEQLKALDARVRLHLSGTPYRILMGGEFSKEDVVAFIQFSDIVQDQKKWDQENLDRDDVNEWDNPYFGFPQMVRFAFHPSRPARRKMEELRKNGVSLALSALLEPQSIKQDRKTGLHKQFKHQPEILDLLRVIDGSRQDDGVLGFLDYARIKEGMMCRHMVLVLPYCASCDAMEALIDAHRGEFKNLGGYEIINISGVEGAKRYKTPDQVKKAIRDAEARGRKTLTLTVNRMLTGSTVEQWDTMLYLKDTSSPQEYDQAVFRLQNQYVRDLYSEDADAQSGVIRENLKPQTLLVDFDPVRLFRMQEQKSLIYNVNTDENGNDKLEERIKEELRISPIITMNLGQIHRIGAASILDAVSEYSSQRSIADEARDVPVDLDVLKNESIRRVIESQAEMGSRAGLTVEPGEGEGNDIDIPGLGDGADRDSKKASGGAAPGEERGEGDDAKSLAKKLQTYYQRILFFAMLTPNHVRSLAGIVDVLDPGDNPRIAKHLSLEPDILRTLLKGFDPFKLSSLDYKIQNISQLMRDERLEPIERASRALRKFTRISDSEVRTPSWLCDEMVGLIPGEELVAAVGRGEALLDIASKSGEFAVSLYHRLTAELGVPPDTIRNLIYSVPTSSIAYEFTRRFYEILGLKVANIASRFTALDLVSESAADVASALANADAAWDTLTLNQQPAKGSAVMKFSAVVGNPPYQVNDGGGTGTSAAPIYQAFVEAAKRLGPRSMTMIIPSRWFAGGKGLGGFRKDMLDDRRLRVIHDFLTASDVFTDIGLKGGVSYFLWDRDNPGDCAISTQYKRQQVSTATRPLLEKGADVFIRFNEALPIVKKVMSVENAGESLSLPDKRRFDRLVSSRKPFGLDSTFKGHEFRSAADVLLHRTGGTRYVARSHVKNGLDLVDEWKIFVGKAAPGTGNKDTYPHRVISTPFIAGPGSAATETYLSIGPFGTSVEAQNVLSYLCCRLTRFLIQLRKSSQNTTKGTYAFVPMQDFSRPWTDCELYAKYGLTDEEIAFVERMVRPMGDAAKDS
jgi:hypothetical protein